MRAIFLLGANFVRSQILLLAIVLGYVLCLTAFLAFHEVPDLIFFIRQQAIYGVALAAMVIAPALQNERRSRRILSVLSKGIHRWEYLGGLLLGGIFIAGAFCLASALSDFWMASQISAPVAGLAELMLVMFLASAAAASTALLCSVFLHPLLALPATALLLLFPLAAESAGWYLPQSLFPVYAALRVVLGFTFQRPGSGLWSIGVAALVHAGVFWAAAAVVFARRDITVPAE